MPRPVHHLAIRQPPERGSQQHLGQPGLAQVGAQKPNFLFLLHIPNTGQAQPLNQTPRGEQDLANPIAPASPRAGPSPRVAGSPQPCFPFGFCQLFDPLANLLQHLPLQLIPSLCDQARQCYVGLAHEGVSFLLLSTGVWLSGDTLFSFTSEFQHEMLQPILLPALSLTHPLGLPGAGGCATFEACGGSFLAPDEKYERASPHASCIQLPSRPP